MVECDRGQDHDRDHGKEIDVDLEAESIYVVIVNVIEVDHGEINHHHQLLDAMKEG